MSADPAIADLSFEDALKRLETIVHRLESGDASLDESIALYVEGDKLRAQCEARLQSAQARIEKIAVRPDGSSAGVQPFDAD
jgi:exodeoxyribonuclease VII small subunit